MLFVTQKIDRNDPILGFVIDWLRVLAKKCEKIVVVCYFRGSFELPENVEVYSLGKEKKLSKFRQVLNFYKYIITLRKKYDSVLVHMVPLWVVLGAPFFIAFRKKVYLWYVHRSVTPVLWMSEKIVRKIFTASEESLGLKTPKKRILHHGILSEQFIPRHKQKKKFDLVTVGRFNVLKDQETFVRAIDVLTQEKINVMGNIVGGPYLEHDKQYVEKVKKFVAEHKLQKNVMFSGFIPHEKIAYEYQQSSINVNLCPTGGIDKTVLEGILAGAIPVVCNESFTPLFGKHAPVLMFRHGDAQSLAKKIEHLLNLSKQQKDKIVSELRDKVVRRYDLEKFMNRLVNELD